MDKKKLIPWIPAAFTVVAAIITCILYVVLLDANRGVMGYFQLFGCMLVPILFPVFGLIFKRPLPTALTWIVTVHVILGNFMGTVLDFYGSIPWFDLFMHGAFGFTGAAVAYTLLARWNGEKLHPIAFYLFIICFVMACGTFWEIFEYVTDGIFPENDAQVTKGLYGRGAVADTMEDLMITLSGLAIFIALMVADKFAKTGIMKKLFVDPQMVKREETPD